MTEHPFNHPYSSARQSGHKVQELYTTDEAATFLRFKPSTLAIWRSRATGPAYLIQNRSIRYHRFDLEEWSLGGHAARTRIEETAECHLAKRRAGKRLRGRAAVKQRARQLTGEPYCRDCREEGQERLADEVDHIVPIGDGGSNSEDNLRSLCAPCHALRTHERLRGKR